MRGITRAKSLWIAALVLGFIGLACFKLSGGEYGWQPMIVGAPALIATVGLLLAKPWSEYLAYCVLMSVILIWIYLTYEASMIVPYSIGELLPGIALLGMCLLSLFAVFIFFRTGKRSRS